MDLAENRKALVWFATHFEDLAAIMSERAGVQNLHLAVEVLHSYQFFLRVLIDIKQQVENEHRMTMLYKATQGIVKEEHYGLALAHVVPLPPGVITRATQVAHKLERQMRQRKNASATVIREKRRKLILNLKEHLVQAHNGVLEGQVLAAWLRELQKEFVNRMAALEVEAVSAEQNVENDEDEEMSEESRVEEEQRSSTPTRQPSVMTIDSYMTTTESESTSPIDTASTIRAVSEN